MLSSCSFTQPPSALSLGAQKVPRRIQASVQQSHNDACKIASSTVPSHMWCLLVQYCDVRDFGAILQCGLALLSSTEICALWHYHAFASGFAQPIACTTFNWTYPFVPEVVVWKAINWRRFLKINSQARTSPGITVRFRDIDLRMPFSSKAGNNSLDEVLDELMELACHQASPMRYCLSSVAKKERGLRLRLLQWAGRPGPVQHGALTKGAHLMVEWVLPGGCGWPLPTHIGEVVESTQRSLRSSSGLFGAVVESPRRNYRTSSVWFAALRRGFADVDPASTTPATAEAPLSSNQHLALVRITSSLLHTEMWLPLDFFSDTLATLFHSIATLLRSTDCHGKLRGDIQFQMMDALKTDRKQSWQETCLLRDLCWTHGETLLVELDNNSRLDSACHKILIWREPEIAQVGGQSTQSTSQPFLSASDRVSEHSSQLPGITMPSHLTRDAVSVTQRSWSEPDDINQESTNSNRNKGPSRQVTVAEDDGFVHQPPLSRQVSLDAPSAGPSRQVSHSSSNWLATHPGDRPLEGYDDNAGWERLAPHYAPRLLMNTHQARQFEFHPSLPEVMLTGDKSGGVNVIDIDQSTIHQPLVVDSCPVLGLSWFRHNPQRAVCGASRSGQIRFLKYDSQASPQGVALEQVTTLEEFPKLSSLSVNCTDDLLLASGFTHDLALYDTNTGKALHRVLGAHTHFINISRFAQQSPHVFATASFDHTCKVWDARQPLVHDKPAKVLHTGFFNVMCTFSPDDRYLLCSGVDTNITQFELPTFSTSPASFQMRPAVHHARYRRSMYLPTGRHFVTAATDESHIRIMSSTGKNLGVVDFSGILAQGNTRSHRPVMSSQRNGSLIHGEVRLDEEQNASATEPRRQKEYVQSVRTHPVVQNRLGVLLSTYVPDQSYITLVDLDPNFPSWGTTNFNCNAEL